MYHRASQTANLRHSAVHLHRISMLQRHHIDWVVEPCYQAACGLTKSARPGRRTTIGRLSDPFAPYARSPLH